MNGQMDQATKSQRFSTCRTLHSRAAVALTLDEKCCHLLGLFAIGNCGADDNESPSPEWVCVGCKQ